MAKAEFGTVLTSNGRRVYRLEFVLGNGERVPATTIYFNINVYGLGDQAKTIAAP